MLGFRRNVELNFFLSKFSSKNAIEIRIVSKIY
jgi:hypothetical protein